MVREDPRHRPRSRHLAWLALALLAPAAALPQAVQVVANDSFMPFSFPDENQKADGISAIMVAALLEKAGISGEARLFPLPRALAMAEEPNTLCYAIFRTAERERKYRWVVPVTLPIRSVLVKLRSRSDIRVARLEDAREYSIGVVNGNNLQALLKDAGFDKQLQAVSTNESNFKKLFAGRIDLLAVRESSLSTELKTLGFAVEDIEVALQLANDGPAWLIASLRTPDAIVNRLQAANEELKKARFLEKTTERVLARFR